jgi:hypothetical protein
MTRLVFSASLNKSQISTYFCLFVKPVLVLVLCVSDLTKAIRKF